MTTKLLLAGALIALLILPAGAQQAPQGTPTRIRGAVEKLDGQALTVKSREGQTVTIALADNVAVAYLVKKNVGDIKPGDYIASTGIKGTDGKLHAIDRSAHFPRVAAWRRRGAIPVGSQARFSDD
jgi:hypothetical protein